jgi:hypothetical protein
MCFGVRHAFMVSCSNSGLQWLSRPSQHNQLLPQRGVLCFKLALGLEERANQVQEEDYQRGHRSQR